MNPSSLVLTGPAIDARILFGSAPFWVVLGFLAALIAGALLLPLLRRFQMRQAVYEDAPPSHRSKSGTPTMGGLVFVAAVAATLPASRAPLLLQLGLLVVACAAVGLLDDYLTIRQQARRGLRARTKVLGDGADRRRVPARARRIVRLFYPRRAVPRRHVLAGRTPLAVADLRNPRHYRNDPRRQSHRWPRRLGRRERCLPPLLVFSRSLPRLWIPGRPDRRVGR